MLARSLVLAAACLLLVSEVYGISSKAEHEVFRNLMRNYEKAIMPKPEDSALGLKFGFTIVSLTIDESTGIAEIFGWEKYGWNDARLTWDPEDKDGVDKLRVEPRYIWSPYPDWTMYNSVQIEADIMDSAMMLVYASGEVLWIPRSRRKIQCQPEGDSYKCMMKFGSWVRHKGLLEPSFYTENSTIDTSVYEVYPGAWKLSDIGGEVVVKKYDCCVEEYPYMSFNFTASRSEDFSSANSVVVSSFTLIAAVFYPIIRNF